MTSRRSRRCDAFFFFLFASCIGACASTKPDYTEPAPATPATPPTVAITEPSEGQTFELTPTEVDVGVAISVTDFALVPLHEEGTDMQKGQVRLFVDGESCNDPGEPDNGEAPSPYNRILPNDHDESTIGLDYCVGGVVAIDDRSHTLRAELWHGDQRLSVAQEITFRTTFRK